MSQPMSNVEGEGSPRASGIPAAPDPDTGYVQLLASTVHPDVHEVLQDSSLMGASLGEAMVRVVDIQLRLHAEQDKNYRTLISQRDEDIRLPVREQGRDHANDTAPILAITAQPATLFAQAATRVAIELGQAKEAEAKAIAKRVPLVASPAFRQAVFKFARLPFVIMTQALNLAMIIASGVPASGARQPAANLLSGAGESGEDIDEWIIRNEKYMRARTVLDPTPGAAGAVYHTANDDASPSLTQLGIDTSSSHWKSFMVGLGRDAHKIFPPDKDGMFSILRPAKENLPGLTLLDEHRSSSLPANSLDRFKTRFDAMTGGLLNNLDWRNVLVAGGIVLAALTSTTDEDAAKHAGSDVDLYLYDLSPKHANAKLQHIEKVFASNLPYDRETGRQLTYGVLRNSLTVTFIPERFPHRRVQVVLKLCANPMTILLNFDLDQIGLGYTGEEVWMLPRTVRALITGYTTFTMDLIHGSFLSPRKATQDQRVFKYAERGYGLRFLPSYIRTLPVVSPKIRTTSQKNINEESLPRDELHVTLREERERVAWWLAQRCDGFAIPLHLPELQMVDIDCRTAHSGELAERSSLSGWQQFARHVALWEYAQQGYCTLDRSYSAWVEGAYADDPLSYQDGPNFDWDHDFTLEKLQTVVAAAHRDDEDRLSECLEAFGITKPHWRQSVEERKNLQAAERSRWSDQTLPLRRTILASSLEEAFAHPLVAMVHLPKSFRHHAESKLSPSFFRFNNITKETAPAHQPVSDWHGPEAAARIRSDAEFELLYWIQGHGEPFTTDSKASTHEGRISPHWQLVDREQDEIIEVVHAFRRAHRSTSVEPWLRNDSVRRQVSRRLVRPTERSERDAFLWWSVDRVPDFTGWYGETEEWAMLKAPRSLVFQRFEVTKEGAQSYADDLAWFDFDEDTNAPGADHQDHTIVEQKRNGVVTEPKTVQEWREYLEARSTWQDWMVWYHQRLPKPDLLPLLRLETEPARNLAGSRHRVAGAAWTDPASDDAASDDAASDDAE